MFRQYLRRTRFHQQLIFVVTLSILILALFSSLIHSYEASQRIRSYIVEQGQHITENMARQSTLALLYHVADNAKQSISATLAFPDVMQVDITDASHKLLVSQSKEDHTQLAPKRDKREPLKNPVSQVVLEDETFSHWHFVAPVYTERTSASPFEAEEYKPQLLGYVYVTLSKQTLHRLIYLLLLYDVGLTFSFALLLLALMRRLARHFTVPFNSLLDLMLQAENGQYSIRATPEGSKDIIEMSHAFNKMMSVLEEREAELKKSRDEALHLAHVKTMFASVLSHEIRTPLNGVIGMLDLLKGVPLAEHPRNYLNIATKSSYLLLDLINNILDFSKMEAGKLELEHIDFDLESTINEVIALVSLQAQQKNLALHYFIAPEVPQYINADPLRLRQVITNLIGNALKFTEKGQVLLHVTQASLSAIQPTSEEELVTDTFTLRFEIRDTGIGMNQEATERIFESFAQADTSTTRKHGGTGLGLAISKQIVELGGGEIGVNSQPEQGTTFWFTLPCRSAISIPEGTASRQHNLLPLNVTEQVEESTAVLPSYAIRATGQTQYTILIAEDNYTNQMVAGSMLELSNCQCEFASNGREAVEAVSKGRYDLIFMDCNMPEMDGYTATEHIRSLQAASGQSTPIIAMTANSQPGDAEKCYAAGMDDYLTKPITLDRVQAKLNQWLKGVPVSALPDSLNSEAEMDNKSSVLLDDTIFRKIKGILGSNLQQTITIFIEDTATYLSRLEDAIEKNESDSIQMMAHIIKGSSSNLGAMEMTSIAKEIEKQLLNKDSSMLPTLLSELKEAFDAVSVQLKQENTPENSSFIAEKRSAQILLVDDDRSIRNTLRHFLQNEGFFVEEAVDGSHALTMLKRFEPQLVIMDALMPIMDGFTACAQIQEQSQGLIPVLMITASEDATLIDRALAVGAVDYIPKPINFPALLKRVHRIISAYQAEAKARYLTLKDPLTDLPNRTHFLEILEGKTEQSQETVALLFMDVYRFKRINDTFGSQIGDRLLIALAQRIKHRIRATDCIARLGGDEFVILLTNIENPNIVGSIAQNIHRALSSPFRIEEHTIFITANIGIAVSPLDTSDAHNLVKYAEIAMHRARKDSIAFQFFKPEMEQSLAETIRLENDLHGIVFDEQLKLVYQPQAQLSDGRIIGMEALIRWIHPKYGMISPLQFIPIAEEMGLINAIGEWVLRTACKQLQEWIQSGLPEIRVGVNVSVRQLKNKHFPTTVEKVLQETGLAPHLLDLEITESSVMENTEETLQVLEQLKNLGIRMSIDDFGTGYSSLSYLRRLPVSTIKIDRSFVMELPDNKDDQAIILSIIALAHSLRLEVIAEGVETLDQYNFLREQHCDLVQGYYLSKPVSPEQFRLLLNA
ncbi:MAG: EAL domain-containing protein [Pseudomonadota bacterium]